MSLWIRINGIGHAFSRELGCACSRCRTVNYNLIPPPAGLNVFDGWDDPPWRAHTSASILVGDAGGPVTSHVLVDCGAATVDSLMSSGLDGLGHVAALLITHWHPDHVLGLNQLCESLRHFAVNQGQPFTKIPVFCTLDTYDWLRSKGGLDYEFKNHLRFQQILPEVAFSLHAGGHAIDCLPIPVAHGWIEGAVIFAAKIGDKKIVFGWDLDVPDAKIPKDGRTNRQVITQHLQNYNPDLLFIASNTWTATTAAGNPTGHTSYQLAKAHYVPVINPQPGNVYLTHMSGHEDPVGQNAYGWTDAQWAAGVAPHGFKVARQGMIINL